MNLDNLKNIIKNKQITPTIINPESNFIISTYWWGRGNDNQNTSRPCIAFFENITKRIQNLCINTLSTDTPSLSLDQIFSRLESNVPLLESYKKLIRNSATSYNQMIFEDLGITDTTDINKDNLALMKLEKLKEIKETPKDFEYKNKEYTERLFTIIFTEMIILIKDNILEITELNKLFKTKKDTYSLITNPTVEQKKDYLREFKEINNLLSVKKEIIKKQLNTKQTYSNENMKEFNNLSIFEILRKEFRYKNPLKYEEMINKWEQECVKFNCNYLTVEYEEFSKPGGYQMAINAKPMFIQQAIESAGHRSIVYIDGDMYVKKYPKLFDMKDVDFMARGWWIDPRSSYKMEESIMYDPYTFETSGGIMMFSQSNESKELINKWIEISSKSYQIGKADDRILSLVFNTYKFLCSMKIIQLPIEYLWLTLDYDERMLDLVYDYNKIKMKETIMIEHPECLTSEDTASGSGASSDRTPRFYGYLEENIDPVSEQYHEYIMFPNEEMTESFKPYFDFMDNVYYIDDGNEALITKNLVNKEDPTLNEQPLYITKYKDKFSNIRYPHDKSLTYNQVAEINMKRTSQMNISDLQLVVRENTVEINNFSKLMKEEDPTKYNNSKIISLIIKLLKENKTVIYNPVSMPDYNPEYYNLLLEKVKTKYKSMELIFVPDFSKAFSTSSNYFYKPLIQTNQPILFTPNEILIKFLMMFLSLDDFSQYLYNGSYEFMSRVRVGYIFKQKIKMGPAISSTAQTNVGAAQANVGAAQANIGGKNKKKRNMLGGNNENDIDVYNEGIDILYKGGKSRIKNKKLKTHKKAHRYTFKINKKYSKRKTSKRNGGKRNGAKRNGAKRVKRRTLKK